MQVLGGMTHPPCGAAWDCQNMLEATEAGCQQAGVDAPLSCKEAPGLLRLDARGAAQRYAATVAANQAEVAKVRERLAALRAQIAPLAAQRAAAAAALKTGQTQLGNEFKAARSAEEKYVAESKKTGTVGLDATRQALRAQFLAVSTHGQALVKDAAAISALDARSSALDAQLQTSSAMIVFAKQDLKSLAGVLDSMSNLAAKTAAKDQADATSKQKVAEQLKASAASDKAKLAAVNKDALAAKARSAVTTEDAAQLKAFSAQATAAANSVATSSVEIEKERQELIGLLRGGPAASAARSQATKAAQLTSQQQYQAQRKVEDLDREQKAAQARHRADAPKAKGCALEQVDLKNFDYSSVYSEPRDRYQNGQLVGGEWEANMRPHVADIQFFDLDGNGKKDAVVFIEGPPSAHSGNDNILYFLALDEQCRIQDLQVLRGPVSPGTMKAKSYFYGELELGTPPGMAGLFPIGNFSVELRYVNGELKEVSRKSAPM